MSDFVIVLSLQNFIFNKDKGALSSNVTFGLH